MRVRQLEEGTWRASCPCDWFGHARPTEADALAEAVEHARRNAWCYVHRNLTPTGAEPIREGERAPHEIPVGDYRAAGCSCPEAPDPITGAPAVLSHAAGCAAAALR